MLHRCERGSGEDGLIIDDACRAGKPFFRITAVQSSARGRNAFALGIASARTTGARSDRRECDGAIWGARPAARRPKKRNDRIDAEELAREARIDVTRLHPIRHRCLQAQADLERLRARDSVVRARSSLINHSRGVVKSYGERVGRCSAEAFGRKARNAVPSELLPALTPVLDLIEQLTISIRTYDQVIEEVITTRYPVADRLRREIPGVGPITALAFILLIDDPKRFAKSRDVGAYFGLCPRLDSSSDSNPQLGITKAGDEFGRRLLVSAAHYILGPFGPACDLRRHGEAIAARGGMNAKKRAVVAVARKLAVMMHRIWMSGSVYNPDRLVNRRLHA